MKRTLKHSLGGVSQFKVGMGAGTWWEAGPEMCIKWIVKPRVEKELLSLKWIACLKSLRYVRFIALLCYGMLG